MSKELKNIKLELEIYKLKADLNEYKKPWWKKANILTNVLLTFVGGATVTILTITIDIRNERFSLKEERMNHSILQFKLQKDSTLNTIDSLNYIALQYGDSLMNLIGEKEIIQNQLSEAKIQIDSLKMNLNRSIDDEMHVAKFNERIGAAIGALEIGKYYIDSTKERELFRIYPNPTQGIFTIDYSLSKLKVVNVRISNILGKILYSETISDINDFKYKIDLSELDIEKGAYWVIVSDGSSVQNIRILYV